MDINSHVKALGQKYMGVRPQAHRDEMFRDASIRPDDGHAVPVSNFLNAQCRSLGNVRPPAVEDQMLMNAQISRRSRLVLLLRTSRLCLIQVLPISGFRLRVVTLLRAFSTLSTTPRHHQHIRQMDPHSRSTMDLVA